MRRNYAADAIALCRQRGAAAGVTVDWMARYSGKGFVAGEAAYRIRIRSEG